MRSLRQFVAAIAPLPLLAACVSAGSPPPIVQDRPAPRSAPPQAAPVPPSIPAPPPSSGFVAPQIMRAPGLENVIGAAATQLQRRFGAPALDVQEGDARKLQFTGEPCVLDIFLYPLRPGAEPVATHVEARRASDGRDVDRAACVRALGSP